MPRAFKVERLCRRRRRASARGAAGAALAASTSGSVLGAVELGWPRAAPCWLCRAGCAVPPVPTALQPRPAASPLITRAAPSMLQVRTRLACRSRRDKSGHNPCPSSGRSRLAGMSRAKGVWSPKASPSPRPREERPSVGQGGDVSGVSPAPSPRSDQGTPIWFGSAVSPGAEWQ